MSLPLLVLTDSLTGLLSLLLVGYLLARGRALWANAFLVAFLVVVAFQTGSLLAQVAGVGFGLERAGAAGAMLLGPCLYLYARALLCPGVPVSGRTLGHALPALIMLAVYSPESRVLAGLAVHASIAMYLGRIVVSVTRGEIEDGEAVRRRRAWLGDMLLASGVSLLAAVVCFWVLQGGVEAYHGPASVGAALAMLVPVGRIAVEGVRRPWTFAGADESPAGVGPTSRPLTPPDAPAAVRARRVVELLGRERLYTDPTLSVESLAERLEVSPRTLSRVVNERLGRSVPELVNLYRVREAQRLLTDEARRGDRILDVLYAVGFNSKSSFNEAFRRVTGMTPSEYRRAETRHGEHGAGIRTTDSR